MTTPAYDYAAMFTKLSEDGVHCVVHNSDHEYRNDGREVLEFGDGLFKMRVAMDCLGHGNKGEPATLEKMIRDKYEEKYGTLLEKKVESDA